MDWELSAQFSDRTTPPEGMEDKMAPTQGAGNQGATAIVEEQVEEWLESSTEDQDLARTLELSMAQLGREDRNQLQQGAILTNQAPGGGV